jgi:hypothetical protein
VVSFTPLPLYPRYPFYRRLGGPQSWSGRYGKISEKQILNIAFQTKSTIQNLVKPRLQDEYENSGVYQRRCMDCPLKYIGQTGRTFKTTYKEHIQAIRNNNGNSRYSKHILNMGHSYGSVTNMMKVLKTQRKGKHLNTLERYTEYK